MNCFNYIPTPYSGYPKFLFQLTPMGLMVEILLKDVSMIEFNANRNKEVLKKYDGKNFEVKLFKDNTGMFEHHSLGDSSGGGLKFEGNGLGRLVLVDFDGVYKLPEEVANILENEFDIIVTDD